MKKMFFLFLLATGFSLSVFALEKKQNSIPPNKKTEKSTKTKNVHIYQKPTGCTQVEVYLSCGGVWEGRFCTPGVLTSALWNSMADLVDLRECGRTPD